MLGVLAYQAGRDEQAIELIGRAVAIVPEDAAAQRNLARAPAWRGWTAKALRPGLPKPNSISASRRGPARRRRPALRDALGERGRLDREEKAPSMGKS